MTFAEFIEDVIRPMFPGVSIESSDARVVWRKNSRVVFARGGVQLRLRESRSADEWFTITRRQVFDPSEKNLVEHLVRSFARAKRKAESFLGPLEETITRTAISASLSNNLSQRPIIADVLKTFSGWATQTYEGSRVAAGAVVTNDETLFSTEFTFENTAKEDFAKALSDGIDSWWVVGSDGAMFAFETAPEELAADEHAFYPLRYAPISVSAPER